MNETERKERTMLGTRMKRSGRCRRSSATYEEPLGPATSRQTPPKAPRRFPWGLKRRRRRGAGVGRASYATGMRSPAAAVDQHGRAAAAANWSAFSPGRVGCTGTTALVDGRVALRENRSPSDAVKPRFARGERVSTNPFDHPRAPRGGADTCRLQHRSRRTNSANRLWCRRPACIRCSRDPEALAGKAPPTE